MTQQKIISEPNPSLKTLRDNKAQWNLPEFRRDGYKNLHKINRHGLLLRSDHVLKLQKNINHTIESIDLVKKMTDKRSFCSLIVGKDQEILLEKYANDFSEFQPQTIMSISKMYLNLFIGELVEQKKLNLNEKISFYLPNIGSGYANASIQDILNMNVDNLYTEAYTDPFSSSFAHESVGGWRLPDELDENENQEVFLNRIKSANEAATKNYSDFAKYKSANSDVIGILVEKISGISLREWLLKSVEAAGFEDALYMATDRAGMPWMSGGGCLITRDFLRMGLLFSRRGLGVLNRSIGSKNFINETINFSGPKYMALGKDNYVFYANQAMKSKDWIGHSGYGGQFLMINLKTNVVAGFFSVLETPSATDENYKIDMIQMLEEIVSRNY